LCNYKNSCVTIKIVLSLLKEHKIRMNRKVLLSLCLTFLFLGCNSQSRKKEVYFSTSEKIDSYLVALEQLGFYGSVLVNHNRETILSKGYGQSDVKAHLFNTSSTVFDIGSISKQFTAAAILKLEMQEKLSVNDKITRYLKNVPDNKKDITIHHLLTHTAGFPGAIGDDYEEISESEFIEKALSTAPLSPIGKTYNYSNIGYSLLAIIIKRVAETTYEGYLNENLFTPAGMTQTGYTLPHWDSKKIAVGYHLEKPLGKPTEKKWAANGPYLHLKGNGGILSTTEDLYKWHLALLGNTILSSEAKKKYYTKHIKEGNNASSHYGYGWAIFPTPRNTELIAHNGGNGIFFADFWRYLAEDITIIILTNKSTNYSEVIASQIAGLILKENFEPQMPDDSIIGSGNLEDIDTLINHLFVTLKDKDENSWEKFISANCAQEFITMAPMETHLSFFSKFNKRLKEGTIIAIELVDNEVIAKIETPSETFNMIVGIGEGVNNELKIEGIMLD